MRLVTDHLFKLCFKSTIYSPILYIPQYGSDYTESAYEGVPFTEPAEEVDDIYDQLAQEKCIEIPRPVLKYEYSFEVRIY